MRILFRLTTVGTLLLLLACDEVTTPVESGGDNLATSTSGGVPGSQLNLLRQDDAAPLLDAPLVNGRYQVSALVTPGIEEEISINYEREDGEDDDDADPFLQLEIDEDALPAGSNPVLVTITVDPTDFRTWMEPTGLQFSPDDPADLSIWYLNADHDFNGDGVIDAADELIRTTQLAIWVQAVQGGNWTKLNALNFIVEEKLDVELEHFSGYAVSW